MFLALLKVFKTSISEANKHLCTSPLSIRISITLIATVSSRLSYKHTCDIIAAFINSTRVSFADVMTKAV